MGTKESFGAMIDFIYNKKTDLQTYEFENLCSLYFLADKYNINVLKEETLRAIRNKEISPSNVLDVALLADKHSTTHGELVEVLYETAAESLSKKFNNQLDKVVEFHTEIDASATSASVSCKSLVKIMKRVKRMKNCSPVCDNCENEMKREFEKKESRQVHPDEKLEKNRVRSPIVPSNNTLFDASIPSPSNTSSGFSSFPSMVSHWNRCFLETYQRPASIPSMIVHCAKHPNPGSVLISMEELIQWMRDNLNKPLFA